jgi:hypothetical protein
VPVVVVTVLAVVTVDAGEVEVGAEWDVGDGVEVVGSVVVLEIDGTTVPGAVPVSTTGAVVDSPA